MADLPRCAEAQELAPEVALGIAPAEDRARLFWHVASCAACRTMLAELAAVTDSMLMLTAEQEPPAGFETRVLARIGEATPRPRSGRPRRRVALVAAGIAVAAMVSGGAVYIGHGADRELAANVRAALATGNGQYFVAAPLDDSRGEQRGVAFGYQGDPAWVFLTASVPAADGPYAVEVITHAGVSSRLADDVDLARTGAWGGTVPVPIHEVAVVRVVDTDGRPVLFGQFRLP
jgi:hypothetical protein